MPIKRVSLQGQLPLETPFSVHIFPIFMCNFKCNYCLHSLSDDQLHQKHFEKQKMDLDVYKKVIRDLAAFPHRLKALIFAGHGEPLLHPEIAQMVAYAKQNHVADRIEIVTNGVLLTEEMSDQLIDAGLDRLRISLQGINGKHYREVTGTEIDFEQFVDNIRYFYRKKEKTDVYIKIIDIALKSKEEEVLFKKIFEPVADEIAIEYAIPFVSEIDISKLGDVSDNCKQGNKQRSNLCSMPFYMMVVYPNGDVIPCCAVDVPVRYGNVKEKSLSEIWQGKEIKRFLHKQLEGHRNVAVCRDCSVPSYGLQNGDYLDGYEGMLKKYY